MAELDDLLNWFTSGTIAQFGSVQQTISTGELVTPSDFQADIYADLSSTAQNVSGALTNAAQNISDWFNNIINQVQEFVKSPQFILIIGAAIVIGIVILAIFFKAK